MNLTDVRPTSDIEVFLQDPWTFLEKPLSVYQDAALLKGHEFDRRKAKAEMSPVIASLLYTRNPQVHVLWQFMIHKTEL